MRTESVVSFTVKRSGRPAEATVTSGSTTVAHLQADESRALLTATDGRRWVMDPRVQGEVRPFSLAVSEETPSGPEPVFTIRSHLFEHGEQMYMLTNIPEGLHPAEHGSGRRYICRLVNFPFKTVSEIDHETWGRLRRHRGVPVGEVDGLGHYGHTVRLGEELRDIALPLAVASYLLYSTA
jgi:hypothetical protein